MNTGSVKRSIVIEEPLADDFSDEIKTNALIEEIEAAELSARQAQLDRQIEASQPSKIKNFKKKAAEKTRNLKKSVKEGIEDLRTKPPEDPRIEKVSLKEGAKERMAAMKEKAAGAKAKAMGAKEAVKKSGAGIKGGLKVAGTTLTNVAGKVNSLAPEGISRKAVVEYCVAGALVVAAGEIWAWNLTHPLFQNTNKAEEKVEIVPITGGEEAEDDSPILTSKESAKDENDKETEADAESETTEDNDSGNTDYYNYSGNSYNYYSGSSSNTSSQTTNSSKKTTNTNKSTASSSKKKNSGVTVDSTWKDGDENMWPAEDSGELPEENTEEEATDNADEKSEK